MFQIKFAATLFCLIGVGVQATGAPIMTVDLPMAQPLAVAYSPDGNQIAIGGIEAFGSAPIDGVVQLVDASNGVLQPLLRHPGTIVQKDGFGSSGSQNRILSLAYSADGKTLAVAAELGLKLWNPNDGKERATLLGYGIDEQDRQVEVTSVEFSPDGKLLAVARSPVELWDITAPKPLRQIDVHGDTTVKFFGASARLVSASYQNEVRVWNVADGKELGRIHAEMGPLYSVAMDPKERHLAAVGEGGEKMWRIEEAASGEWRFVDEVRLRGHTMSAARQVSFSSDGRCLATAGDDGALVLYDASTQQIIGTLLAGGPFAFSPDGKSMAVAQFRDDRRSNTRPPGTQPKGGTRLTVWKVDDLLNANRLSEQARAAAAEMVQTMTAARPDRRMIQGVVAVLSGPQAEVATPTLVDALANPAVNEKHLLLFPLGRIAVHDAKARTALIEALRSHPEVDVRSMAAAMLAELPKDVRKEAVPALVEAALHDENPQVSSSAARPLQRLDPAAYKTVTEKLQARGPVVAKVERRDGKLFYQGRSLEEWIKRLSVSYIPNEIFGRPRPDEPLAAIRAIGVDAVPVLVDTLKSDEWPLRLAAAAGLETLGPPAALAIDPLLAIISATKDDDLTMAVASASAVAAILKPANEPPAKLLAMLNSEKPVTRLGAACAVAQIQSNHARAIQTLKAALESSQRRRDWRFDVYRVGAFTPQPTLEWLTRTLADPETPRDKRIQAVVTLSQLGVEALPALPALLTVIGEDDDFLTREVELAIQRIGPKSIPAVRDALTAATSERTRKRLSSTLWGIGEEGRRTLKELLTKDDAESLWWWAALTSQVGDPVAMQYQMAASETLQKLGHAVAPPTRRPGAPQTQGTANAPGPAPFAKPNAKWLVKTLTDGDIPKQLRVQVSGELGRVPIEEVLPELPTLLSAIGQDDPGIGYPIQKVVMRLGSQAVPAVRDALKNASSNETRQRLISTLAGMGTEGQSALQELLKSNPALGHALSGSTRPAGGDVAQLKDQAERGLYVASLGRANQLGAEAVDELMKVAIAYRGEQTSGPIDAVVLGELRMIAGNPVLAERAFRSAIERGEKRAFSYKSLGWSLVAQRKADEAKTAFEQALLGRRRDAAAFDLAGAGPDEMTAAYFLDLITEEHYVQHLAANERMACFPCFYVGQRREIEDKQADAISAYQRCVELGKDGTAHPVRALARWRLEKLRDEQAQNARPLTNGDFHAGLDGWQIEGGASSFHTFHDETGWWLSTFGDRQDGNTGRLYQSFKVPNNAAELKFKLGGGGDIEKTYVALWRKERIYQRLAARNSNTELVEGRWDLTPLRGEVVTLEIVDRSTAKWGFIGVQGFTIVRGKSDSSQGGRTWNVDFQGDSDHLGLYGQTNPVNHTEPDAIWNTFEVQAFNSTTKSESETNTSKRLLDANGNNSDVVLSFAGNLVGWAGSSGADSLLGDYLILASFAGIDTSSVSWTISGLDANREYDLTFFAHDERNRSRGIRFAISGERNFTQRNGDPPVTVRVFTDDNGTVTGTAVNMLKPESEGDWAGLQIKQADPNRQLRESSSRAARLTYERYANLTKLQEWNDASGDHSTLARYIGHDPQLKWVRLEVVGGDGKDRTVKETTVPFDKLSATCQSRVRQIAALQAKMDDHLKAESDMSDQRTGSTPGSAAARGSHRPTPAFQVIKTPATGKTSGASGAERAIERIHVSISANFTPVDTVVTTTWPAGGSIKLSSTRPPEILNEPTYRGNSQKHGRLQLGTRENKTYHMVYDVLDGNIVGLYFDRNQNRNLADDNGPLEIRGRRPMAAEIVIPIDQLIPDLQKTGDFHIVLLTNEQLWKVERASHYSRTQLKGRIDIAGNSYLAYLGERGVMGLNDADFTNDGIYIDLNSDGKIQSEEEYVSNQWTVRGNNKEYSFDIQW